MKLPAAVEAWAQFAADGGTKRADAEFVAREVAREILDEWFRAHDTSFDFGEWLEKRFGPFDTPRVERRVGRERRESSRWWPAYSARPSRRRLGDTDRRKDQREDAMSMVGEDPKNEQRPSPRHQSAAAQAVSQYQEQSGESPARPASAADHQWPSDFDVDLLASFYKPDSGLDEGRYLRALAKQRRELRERAEKAERELSDFKQAADRSYIALRAELEAKIDRLMLEYCPDEMTADQLENWALHQKAVDPQSVAGIISAINKRGRDADERKP